MPTATHPCQEMNDGVCFCNSNARTLVQPRGRSEGPYWLCDAHASHYLRNRNCEDVTPTAYKELQPLIAVTVGVGNFSYRIKEDPIGEVYMLLSKLEKQS